MVRLNTWSERCPDRLTVNAQYQQTRKNIFAKKYRETTHTVDQAGETKREKVTRHGPALKTQVLPTAPM